MKVFTYKKKCKVNQKGSLSKRYLIKTKMIVQKFVYNEQKSRAQNDVEYNCCQQKQTKGDFLLDLFQRGMHHILENIILSLPPRSILVCRQVSKEWNSVIDFYHQSRNPRIQKLQAKRLDLEWNRGEPILQILNLPGTAPSTQVFSHIAGDKKHVAIAGLYSDTLQQFGQPYIHILDPKTFQLIKLISVQEYLPESTQHKFYLNLNLAFTEDLIFLTGLQALNINSKLTFWAAWSRKDWSFCGVQLCGALPLPWNNWNLGPTGTTTPIALTPIMEEQNHLVPSVALLHKSNGFLHYKIKISNHSALFISSAPDEHVLSLKWNGKEQWIKAKNEQVRVIGFNEEYVLVTWSTADMSTCVLDVYRMKDGTLMQTLNKDKEFQTIYRAQTSHGRIAIRGFTGNLNRKPTVIVYDLKSGKKMLDCGTLFSNLAGVEHFILEKERIVFLERLCWPNSKTKGRVLTATFWV